MEIRCLLFHIEGKMAEFFRLGTNFGCKMEIYDYLFEKIMRWIIINPRLLHTSNYWNEYLEGVFSFDWCLNITGCVCSLAVEMVFSIRPSLNTSPAESHKIMNLAFLYAWVLTLGITPFFVVTHVSIELSGLNKNISLRVFCVFSQFGFGLLLFFFGCFVA